MTTHPSISVIIPTYQRRDSLAQALRALAQQTLEPAQYEVIVSIDGSEDGTREWVAEFSAPYVLRGLWQPNRGRAAACNAGIRAAGGELLLLLDDDMEPAPDCLAQHLHAHPPDSRLGVLGAAPIRVDEKTPPVAAYIGAKFNAHLTRLAQSGQPLFLRDFYSGHFSIRRTLLVEIGGFDEAFKIYGNEDLELSLRMKRAGITLAYNPAAVAYQHYTKNFSALARDTIAEGRTAVLLASKYPEVLPDLRLSTYAEGSLPARLVRYGSLALSRAWRHAPELVIAASQWLEQHYPGILERYCALILGYFYWLGADAALRENRRRGQGLMSL